MMVKQVPEKSRKQKRVIMLLMMMIAPLLMGALCEYQGGNAWHGGGTNTSSNNTSSVSFSQLKMLDANNGWATTPGGVLKTADGGQKWTDVTPQDWEPVVDPNATPTPGSASGLNENKGIEGAFFLDMNHSWIISSDSSTAIPQPDDEGNVPTYQVHVSVRATIDGGATWMDANTLEVKDLTQIYPPSFINAHEGWMEFITLTSDRKSYNTLIYHTTDGGINWSQQSTVDYGGTAAPLGLTMTQGCVITKKACANAIAMPTQGCTTPASKDAVGLAVASDQGTLPDQMQTSDGGDTWLPNSGWPTPGGAPDQSDQSVIAALSPTILTDGTGILPVEIQGSTGGLTAGNIYLHVYQIKFDTNSQVTGYVGEFGGGTLSSSSTVTDLGPTSTFSVPLFISQPVFSAVDKDHIFVMGRDIDGNWGLYELNGKTWTAITAPPATDAAGTPTVLSNFLQTSMFSLDFISPTEGWATNATMLYHITVSGSGATWTQVYPPPTAPNATPDTAGYAATRTPGTVVPPPGNAGACDPKVTAFNQKFTVIGNKQGYFAPYYEGSSLTQAAQDTGASLLSLAFTISAGGCQPALDGALPAAIKALQAAGKDVIASFGGADGQELGQVCGSAADLAAAYQKVISSYGITRLDFDIEGGTEGDTAAVDRRNQAIAQLQKTNTNLLVSYTLPASPGGLTGADINLLKNAVTNKVQVNVVNLMTMDYGGGDPSPGDMGNKAIQSATAAEGQLANDVYQGQGLSAAVLWHMIGITPMLGINDDTSEIFRTEDATLVAQFAASHHLGELSFWEVGRDNSCPGGGSPPGPDQCSGTSQSAYQFSQIFNKLTP